MTSRWGLTVLFRSYKQIPRLGFESLKVPYLASYIASGTNTNKQGHFQVWWRKRRGGPMTLSRADT